MVFARQQGLVFVWTRRLQDRATHDVTTTLFVLWNWLQIRELLSEFSRSFHIGLAKVFFERFGGGSLLVFELFLTVKCHAVLLRR